MCYPFEYQYWRWHTDKNFSSVSCKIRYIKNLKKRNLQINPGDLYPFVTSKWCFKIQRNFYWHQLCKFFYLKVFFSHFPYQPQFPLPPILLLTPHISSTPLHIHSVGRWERSTKIVNMRKSQWRQKIWHWSWTLFGENLLNPLIQSLRFKMSRNMYIDK